ncbi:MAG: transcriptional regulator [Acidimicrobiia bacterium]
MTPGDLGVALEHLDRALMHPVRLSMVAALGEANELEFSALRDLLGISDSVCSKQITSLEALGYVTVRKGFVGKRPRTWVELAVAGRRAFGAHRAALLAIADRNI